MRRLTFAVICIMLFCVISGCSSSPNGREQQMTEPVTEDAAKETGSAAPQTEETAQESTASTDTESGGWKDITAGPDETEAETESTETEPFDGNVDYTYDENGRKVSDDARGFVSISEYIPDVIIEARYFSTYNFVGDRIDGYEQPVMLLSREAAEALKGVSDEMLEKGYRLKIYDAYRPRQAETHFVNWARDVSDARMKEYFYPGIGKAQLFPYGYIAEYSGHCRGSSVDLTLFDMKTGKDVDMGGTFDDFGPVSHPDYTGITTEQYNNRMMLRECMLRHGFTPISQEWWHFNLAREPYPDIYFTFPVSTESVSGR